MSTTSTSSETKFELPVVDFAPFLVKDGDDAADSPKTLEAQRQVAQAIDDACRRHGFLCLRNTGIARATLDAAFRASQDLFGSSPDRKAQFKSLDPSTNTGYNSNESLNRRRQGSDLKETFNVRNPHEEGYTGFAGTTPEFQDVAKAAWDEIMTLSARFAECCALANGLERDYFSKTLKTMDLCTLRMLHYPPCPDVEFQDSDAGCAIRVGEHTDFGIFTFLFIHDFHDKASHGLQVKPIEGADIGRGSLVELGDDMFTSGWQDVVFGEEFLATTDQDESCSMLVNTGALLARWTNDVWRATAHRVVVKPESKDSHRYSIAAFFDPDRGTICSVHPKFVEEGKEAKYPPISSLDYLQMKLREAQELSS